MISATIDLQVREERLSMRCRSGEMPSSRKAAGQQVKEDNTQPATEIDLTEERRDLPLIRSPTAPRKLSLITAIFF